MNLGVWPDGVPFDPAAGVESLELEAIISGPGADWHGVLLAVGERARQTGWGARAAIAIAEAWARTGRRVVLADLNLERPDLHEHLGLANGEGVADVFLFGASLAGVTHQGEHTFAFLPPGAYVPDADAIYGSEQWSTLLNRLRAENTVLLAYTPAEGSGVPRLARHFRDVIVLALDPDALQRAAGLESARIQLVLRPATPVPLVDASSAPDDDADEPGIARRPPPDDEDGPAAGPVVAAPEPPAEPAGAYAGGSEADAAFDRVRVPRDAEREELIADLRQRQREAMLVPPPAPTDRAEAAPPAGERVAADRVPAYPPRPPEHGMPPTEPDFAAAEQPKPRRRNHRQTVIIAVIVVAVLSGIAGAWRLISGMAEQRRARAPAEEATLTAPGPAPASATLSYSVALEAHANLPTALDRIDALRAEDDRFTFYLTPVLVDDVVYYRLMAGPVADSTVAAAMMAALVEAGHKTAASDLDIRETPLAFQLGMAASRAEAERRVQELRQLGVPAYVVLDDTDQGIVYRVYGGAYTASAEADVMREILRTAGQPDSLVTRTGRSTQ